MCLPLALLQPVSATMTSSGAVVLQPAMAAPGGMAAPPMLVVAQVRRVCLRPCALCVRLEPTIGERGGAGGGGRSEALAHPGMRFQAFRRLWHACTTPSSLP